MKKLLYTTILALIPYVAHGATADTYTNGIPVLVLPSTNTIDTKRSIGDKFNTNFSALSSTMNTINNTLQTSSNIFNSAILVLRSQHNNIISTNIVNNTITEQNISSGSAFTISSMTAFNITVASGVIISSSFVGSGMGITNAVKISSAGTFIAANSSINFVAGQNIGLSVTNFSSNVTVNIYGGGSGSGGGGATVITTFTKTIASGGPVYIASATFNSIPGKQFSVGKTTYNVFEMRAYVGKKSTVTVGTPYIYCRIAESTAPQQAVADNFWAFRYVSPIIEITTQSAYSLWVTTAFPLYPQNNYTMHITSVPSSGDMPEDLKIEMNYWRLP